jgi:cytochrome c oxidase assembly factor CtaG
MHMLVPPNHGNTGAEIWSWTWEPTVLVGLALLTAAYLYAAGPLQKKASYGPPVPRRRIVSFLLGNLVVFFALVSPLDHLSDHILFSAHMVQHILLIGFAPVLWLTGLPDGLLDYLIRPAWLRTLAYELTRVVPAFLILNGILLFWHIPGFYDAALESEPLHAFEHLTFMAAAVVGWWPVFGRFPEAAPRASLGIQIFYLFLMMFPSTALAAWITLSPIILYPFYGNEPLVFGLTPIDDQQLSGLIMWIPGNALFFIVFSLSFIRWFQQSSQDTYKEDETETTNPSEEVS